MDWTTLLFSFKGRINRGKYWLAILIYTVVWIAFIAAAAIVKLGFLRGTLGPNEYGPDPFAAPATAPRV